MVFKSQFVEAEIQKENLRIETARRRRLWRRLKHIQKRRQNPLFQSLERQEKGFFKHLLNHRSTNNTINSQTLLNYATHLPPKS